jgi:hypothetical protein
MSKLHELLAVEKTHVNALNKLLAETSEKFGKDNYFKGYVKTLTMLEDSAENSATEKALSDCRELPTTVPQTLKYVFDYWIKAEDIIFQKNCSNQRASADLEFKGNVIAKCVPVDELMGLEARLEALRRIIDRMPTHDASKKWVKAPDLGDGVWTTTTPDVTTKTEKRMIPVILHEATKEHPAQVKESTKDEVVGTFTTIHYSGAATSAQKAECLAILDELISETKKSRMRANSIESSTDKIGQNLVKLILSPFE